MTTKLAGIDPGTSATKTAVPDTSGNPIMIQNAAGELSTPSVVYFDGDQVLVGTEAVNAGLADPSRCVANSKRHMGTDTVLFTHQDGTEYRAPDIARIILAEVARNHEAKTGELLVDVAISVPANFNDRQKSETKEAAEAAGLNVVAMPHEPTSAVLGNGLHRRGDGLVLVIDLGGGTFDCTLAEVSGNSISVLVTDGEPDLGGYDFNLIIERELLDRFEAQHGLRPTPDEHPLEFQDLVQRVEQLKITLSARESAPIFVSCGGQILNTIITRGEFEAKSKHLVERAMVCAERTLKDAGVEPGDLRDILLAGGASLMPLMASETERRFGRKPTAHADPHFGAALGNVIAARMELERQGKSVVVGGRKIPPLDLHARDVTAHPIGVKVMTGDKQLVNSVILGKGAPIPSDRTELFLLAERGQTDALIELLQGPDGADSEKCLKLGHFELTDMEPVEGDHRIEIRLKIDRNGMLSATARDPIGGRSAELSIDYKRSEPTKPARPSRRKPLARSGASS